jgi:hypothetical protein
MNRNIGNNQNFYIDFHYCRSGITGDLEQIREREETRHTNRPYCWYSEAGTDNGHDFSKFEKVRSALSQMDADGARGDVKSILESIFKGESYFVMETERLKAKYKGAKNGAVITEILNQEYKKQIFDACLFYDVWPVTGNGAAAEEDETAREDETATEGGHNGNGKGA